MDYQNNSKKSKEPQEGKVLPEKVVEKVISGEAVVQKKPLGTKVKDLFVAADFRSVARYVVYDVLIPAARNMIVDTATKGVERMMYGESAVSRRGYGPGPRVTYNNPINRGYQPVYSRNAPPIEVGPRRSSSNIGRFDYLLTSREDADLVLERMSDIIDTYEAVSLSDLNEMLGLPSQHTDIKWGWTHMNGAGVRQVRDGYLIELSPAEPL